MAQHNLTDTITFRRGLTIPNRIALLRCKVNLH